MQGERNDRIEGGVDIELAQALEMKDEMSISQFITARMYAKKMTQFLRTRQAEKER